MNAMFAQLDTGSSYRRHITRELWPAGGPHRPITTKDLAAFESITPVEAKPVEEWENRKQNKRRPFNHQIPEGIDLREKIPVLCARYNVREYQVSYWRKIATPDVYSPPEQKPAYSSGQRSFINWGDIPKKVLAETFPEVIAEQLGVTVSAVRQYMARNGIRTTLPDRRGTMRYSKNPKPPHSPAQPDAHQTYEAMPEPSPGAPATPQ